MKYLLVLSVILLVGCSTSPRVVSFPALGLTLIQTDEDSVRKNCNVKVTDRGLPITEDMRIRGCWKSKDKEIWLDWSESDMELLIHELCHADGTRNRLECAELSGY